MPKVYDTLLPVCIIDRRKTDMSNQFLDAAIEYASKGMAVFPLKAKGKEPMTAHGVKNATTNFDTIEKWWTRYPNANIGIACGAVSGGLLVVDLDEKENGVSGSDSLHNWERENGELPETVRSIKVTETEQKNTLGDTNSLPKGFEELDDNTIIPF